MDQRVYYGNIDPNALADYLVGIFHQQPPVYYQPPRTMAQKIKQGERIYVQIMQTGDWSGHGHRALGIHIARIAGGVSVEMGSSDWLNLDETDLAGMLLGALFFPPLLLFPLIHGLTGSNFSQDVWNTIDVYCMQAGGGRQGGARAPQGFYCTYCGAFNHPGAPYCHACHAPFNFAPPQAPEPSAQRAEEPPAPAPQEPAPQPEVSTDQTSGDAAPALVICPACHAEVAPANFCGNCAAPLHRPEVQSQG